MVGSPCSRSFVIRREEKFQPLWATLEKVWLKTGKGPEDDTDDEVEVIEEVVKAKPKSPKRKTAAKKKSPSKKTAQK